MQFFVKAFFTTFFFAACSFAQDFTKEKVTFYSKKDDISNERIARKGILIKRKNAPATIIICHGYGNNKFFVSPFRLFFKEYNTLTFDFRAHGEQIIDQCCTIGHDEVHDLFAAVDFVKSQPELKDKPILIWAPSMGAATAIEAVAKDPNLCVGMFLDAPFPSSQDLIQQGIAKLKLCLLGYEFSVPGSSLLSKYAFNSHVQAVLKYLLKKIASLDATKIETFVKPVYPIESIKKIKVPCFFVVCKNDEKISVDAVKRIYCNHCGPKRLWITNGEDHCHSVLYNPEKYEKLVNEFFKSVLSGQIYKDRNRELIIMDPEED